MSAPSAEMRETLMDHIVVAVATGMSLVFGVGVIAGVIAMVAIAIRREDRLRSLTPRPAARGARRLNGVGLRDITSRDAEEMWR